MTRYLQVMTDKDKKAWEHDPEYRAWMLEIDLWERNYGMESMDFSSELHTADQTEVGLNEWKESLFNAHNKLKVACKPYAPNAVIGARLVGVNVTLDRCRKILLEMLRILNPEEKKYKVWYAMRDREQFLKDIGFLQGTLKPTGGIQTLLARMKKLYA